MREAASDSQIPCIARAAGCTQPASASTKLLYRPPSVIGGLDPGIPLLDEIKVGRKPDRKVILSAQSQSIPRPVTGILDDVGKYSVSGDTRVFHTDDLKRRLS